MTGLGTAAERHQSLSEDMAEGQDRKREEQINKLHRYVNSKAIFFISAMICEKKCTSGDMDSGRWTGDASGDDMF